MAVVYKKTEIYFSSSAAVLSIEKRGTNVYLFTTYIHGQKKPRIIYLSVTTAVKIEWLESDQIYTYTQTHAKII